MRRLILVAIGAIGLSLFSIPSFAQEVVYPKAEVFGGFSISSTPVVSFDPTTFLPTSARNSFMGWQASGNYNLTHHLLSWVTSAASTNPLPVSRRTNISSFLVRGSFSVGRGSRLSYMRFLEKCGVLSPSYRAQQCLV